MIHKHTTTTNASTTTSKTNPGSFLLGLHNNSNPTQDNKTLYNYTINIGETSNRTTTITTNNIRQRLQQHLQHIHYPNPAP
jgi:hypothetical protein